MCISEVGSEKFDCVLRSYKEETYCMLFELFVLLFTCRWLGHYYRGNAARFYLG